MGNICRLLLIILITINSCTFSDNKKKQIDSENSFSQEWKLDSLGCLGVRKKNAFDDSYNLDKFENNPIELLKESLGKSNGYKEFGNKKYFYYCISCCKLPPRLGMGVLKESNRRSYNEYATQVIVKVDSLDIIESIIVAQP